MVRIVVAPVRTSPDGTGSLVKPRRIKGFQQKSRTVHGCYGPCRCRVLKVERRKRLWHNMVTSLVWVVLPKQNLTPCDARGPERFFMSFGPCFIFWCFIKPKIAEIFQARFRPATFHL